jgi:galactose-1-phosphate uridylyltransferase
MKQKRMFTVPRQIITQPFWQNVCQNNIMKSKTLIEHQLSEELMDFWKNRSCTDAIFTLRQQVEKNIECSPKIFVTFVDQEKAFDRVDRNLLWKTLGQYGVNAHLTNICKSCCIVNPNK